MSFLLNVRVQPGAPKTETAGLLADGSVKVRLNARPVKGEANRELVAFLAGRLGVRTSSVRILRGLTTRNKTVVIDGIEEARAMALLKEV